MFLRLAAVLCVPMAIAAAPQVHPQLPPPAAGPPLLGFSSAQAAAERALEARYDSLIRPENQRDWMQQLTARPHHLGSPGDKANAELIARLFRSWGFDTAIEEFTGYFPTPRLRRLELVAPVRFTAALAEPPLAGDRTSALRDGKLPPYAAYSSDGEATAELVYANFGMAEDYEQLRRDGIDVRGKIVLVRYGRLFRGIKPKLAAEHGAAGCIVYSDPHEDGYFLGDPYPVGRSRPEHGVQLGSFSLQPLYQEGPHAAGEAWRGTGAPLASVVTTRIPTLAISAGDALPLLRAMTGPVAPEAWRGALPVTYHLGPGAARVRLAVASDWRQTPVYDVIARLAGRELPDQWILRGNHHDAWVYGAEDPVSGMVSVMAEARAVGELARQGWRPRRTIIYAAWDGEEPALMGSTAWAETHAAELGEHLVAYINSDSNSRGIIGNDGSYTLATLADQACRDVMDPDKGVSIGTRARAAAIVNGEEDEVKRAREGKLPMDPPSANSDDVPFLFFVGAASLDTAFGGDEPTGGHHSIYDSFDYFVRFLDPGFRYGAALSKLAGRLVLRLAEADVVPLDFVPFADALDGFVTEVARLADRMRQETAETNRRIAEHTYEILDDPALHLVPPQPREQVPALDYAPLRKAVAALKRSAGGYAAAMTHAEAAGLRWPAGAAAELDRLLLQAEHTLIRPDGLPHQAWFRHQVYGEGMDTGRAVTLPAIRNALVARDWREAAAQILVTTQVVEDFARQVDRATSVLEGLAAAGTRAPSATAGWWGGRGGARLGFSAEM
jgi:N-acetylated-alpha-linked acidic dipeptidase